MDKECVSVVMALYNGENYIISQMDSLRMQTREADEIIIQDANSTDRTYQIVEEYIAKHELKSWKLYRNGTNLGFRKNFYEGIQKTTGTVIFLCDQDDIWKQNKIQQMLKIMKKRPEILVLNTAIQLIDSKGDKILHVTKKGYCNENFIEKSIPENKIEKFSIDSIVEDNIAPGCTMCFRAEIRTDFLKYHQLFEQLNIEHDYFINILGCLRNATYFWNKVMTNYRIHENNTIGISAFKKEEQNFREQRISQGRTWMKHYAQAVSITKYFHRRDLMKSYLWQLKYHSMRTEALSQRKLYCYVKTLPYWLWRRCGGKISIKMIVVDILYILGIKYH